MAANALVASKVASLGMHMIQPQQGLAALELLLSAPAITHARTSRLLPAVTPVIPLNWNVIFGAKSKVSNHAYQYCQLIEPCVGCTAMRGLHCLLPGLCSSMVLNVCCK